MSWTQKSSLIWHLYTSLLHMNALLFDYNFSTILAIYHQIKPRINQVLTVSSKKLANLSIFDNTFITLSWQASANERTSKWSEFQKLIFSILKVIFLATDRDSKTHYSTEWLHLNFYTSYMEHRFTSSTRPDFYL